MTEAVESCSRFVAALTAVHGRPARVARQTALQRLADARRTLQEAQPGKGGTRSANRSRYLEAVLTATGDVFSAAVSAMDALSGMAIPAGDPLGARLGQVIGSAASSMRASVAVIRGRPLDEPDRLGSAVDALAAAVRAARDRASADPAQLRAFAATGRTLVELSRLAGRVTRLRRLADTTEPAGGAGAGQSGEQARAPRVAGATVKQADRVHRDSFCGVVSRSLLRAALAWLSPRSPIRRECAESGPRPAKISPPDRQSQPA